MIEFSEILDNIRNFYSEKKAVAILITILVVLFFLSLIAFIVYSNNLGKEVQLATQNYIPLNADQKLLTPEGPSIPDGYALTRKPQDKWTTLEAEEYFTLPDSTELNKLESANEKLVNDILGAAP